MDKCMKCPVYGKCGKDTSINTSLCIAALMDYVASSMNLLNQYQIIGEPEKLVKPIRCKECGLYIYEYGRCIINGDEWEPENYCSYAKYKAA